MSDSQSKLPHDVPRSLDLRWTPNVFQASTVVVLSIVGAIVGYHAVNVGKWIAAAGGGVVGMVVATFTSGLVLMFTPRQPVPSITMDAWIAKYRRWRRRLTFATALCVGWFAVTVIWPHLGLPAGTSLIACWFALIVVLYAVAQYHAHVLRLCRCPGCDEWFRLRGALARYPHRCRSCNFTIARDREIAT